MTATSSAVASPPAAATQARARTTPSSRNSTSTGSAAQAALQPREPSGSITCWYTSSPRGLGDPSLASGGDTCRLRPCSPRPCHAVGVVPEDLAHPRRARDVIDRDYAEPLNVAALARVALMSPAHFSRQFRAAYGETPHNYLMTRRIERAKALLRRGDLSVTEVCMAVGCTSLGSFSSRFTELVGESPSAYRARNHDEGAVIPACIAKIYTRPVRNGEAKRSPRPLV